MKIKIGNFNFISDKENKYGGYDKLDDYIKYFYLDGKEDILYVKQISDFERGEEYAEYFKYENSLKEKFKIISPYRIVKEQIQEYVDNKVENIFKNGEYSKYELYKDVDFGTLVSLNEASKYSFGYGTSMELDFDSNRINVGRFQFNPYTVRVENLDELYKEGIFKDLIKATILKKEIESGIAPPYIKEINKIMNYLEDKENVNIIFNKMEKFKCRASIGHFLNINNGILKINLGYHEENNFKKLNPGKKEEDLKISELIGISYGKNVLEIDNRALANIDMQIAISPEDRLKLRIKNLKNEIENDFSNYMYNLPESIHRVYYLKDAIEQIKNIENENKQIKEGLSNRDEREYPEWYNKELNEIFYKYNLINSLEKCQTLEEIKEISVELEDNELKEIYYSLLNREGLSREFDLEDELEEE